MEEWDAFFSGQRSPTAGVAVQLVPSLGDRVTVEVPHHNAWAQQEAHNLQCCKFEPTIRKTCPRDPANNLKKYASL